MSTYTLASLSIDGRTRPVAATPSTQGNPPSAIKRGLGIVATLLLVAGPVAAQATDAIDTPIDIGRMALAFGVLLAVALLKVWAYGDKRHKLMDRLTGYLASRSAHGSRQPSPSAHAHADAAKAQAPASKQQRQRSSIGTQATTAPSPSAVSRGARPAGGFRVLPVPGLPSHMQYLSD